METIFRATMLQSQATEGMRSTTIQIAGLGPALHMYPLHSLQINIPKDWYDEEYREAYLESHTEQIIGWQIKINREARGLTQKGLASLCNTKQPVISRLESAESTGYNVSTLLKIAHAFKCALDIRFVPYSKMAGLIENNSPLSLYAEGFENDKTNVIGIEHGK
jgi:transcriptional regulator with XRE-family HTH domain